MHRGWSIATAIGQLLGFPRGIPSSGNLWGSRRGSADNAQLQRRQENISSNTVIPSWFCVCCQIIKKPEFGSFGCARRATLNSSRASSLALSP